MRIMRLMVLLGLACLPERAPANGAGAEPGQVPSPQAARVGYLEESPLDSARRTLQDLLTQLRETPDRTLLLPPELAFSPGRGHRKELDAAARRLMERADLAIILASGAAAADALLLANNGRTPILAFSIEDGAAEALLARAAVQGTRNFHVRLDTGFAKQGLYFFHCHTRFKRLGLLIRSGDRDKPHSIADTVQRMGRELGFESRMAEVSPAETPAECAKGIQTLLEQGIDAFYVGAQVCFEPQYGAVGALLEPLTAAGVLTFAREGAEVVRQGALMGHSSNDFQRRGQLLQQQVADILRGAPAEKAPKEPATIARYAFNLEVAVKAGFDPVFPLLAACDEFFPRLGLAPGLSPASGTGDKHKS